MFESRLPKYIRDRTKLENASDSVLNLGEIYLKNKEMEVGEGVKVVMLAKLKEDMSLAVQTGRDINNLAKWSHLTLPKKVGVTWFKLRKDPRSPFHLYFSTEEAQELTEIADKLDQAAKIMMPLGVEVNIEVVKPMELYFFRI